MANRVCSRRHRVTIQRSNCIVEGFSLGPDRVMTCITTTRTRTA